MDIRGQTWIREKFYKDYKTHVALFRYSRIIHWHNKSHASEAKGHKASTRRNNIYCACMLIYLCMQNNLLNIWGDERNMTGVKKHYDIGSVINIWNSALLGWGSTHFSAMPALTELSTPTSSTRDGDIVQLAARRCINPSTPPSSPSLQQQQWQPRW